VLNCLIGRVFFFLIGENPLKQRLSAVFLSFLIGFSLNSCTWILSQSAGYDKRPMTLQTFSLYHQRLKGRLSERQWKGDWILRRHRLALIDSELKGIKPDIALFQQLMSRRGSPSESDRAILSIGALMDYDWDDVVVREYADTEEIETSAVVVSPSLAFAKNKRSQNRWALGEQGFLHHTVIYYENQPIDIFNLQFDVPSKFQDIWLDFLESKIHDRSQDVDFCQKRMIIAGYIPFKDLSENFQKFILRYDLKDSATGFCLEENRCYTSTPSNEIFLATIGDESPTRSDRVYLNQSTFIYDSRRNFSNPDPKDEYAKAFGMAMLWPSQRFGWNVQLRLPRCSE